MASEEQGCVFCDIVMRGAPAHIIEEDELSLCVLDINPLSEGHCLVVAKRHVTWWHDLNDDESVSLFRMAKSVANRLKSAFAPDFVCMYARGRRIPHTHLFLVPTSTGDVVDGIFTALERFQESPGKLAALKDADQLAATEAKIRAAR